MSELPTIRQIEKKLDNDDPEFRSWVASVPDKHWAKYDLSAIRLGYELGKIAARATQEQPK